MTRNAARLAALIRTVSSIILALALVTLGSPAIAAQPDQDPCVEQRAALDHVQQQIRTHNAEPHVFEVPEQQAAAEAYDAEAARLNSVEAQAASELRTCGDTSGADRQPNQDKPNGPAARNSPGSASTKAIVDEDKYKYLFGKVTSDQHNAARSVQNARQLARVGVFDTPAGRALLQRHFDDVAASKTNIIRTYTDQYGTFQIRDSLFAGPRGFIHFETTWQVTDDGLRLTTVIPRGGR
jgi:hypothetical protein